MTAPNLLRKCGCVYEWYRGWQVLVSPCREHTYEDRRTVEEVKNKIDMVEELYGRS